MEIICVFMESEWFIYEISWNLKFRGRVRRFKSVSGKGSGSVKKIPLLTLVHFYCSHPSRGFTSSRVSRINRASYQFLLYTVDLKSTRVLSPSLPSVILSIVV
jgi:hypothetical protein